jgi:chromosome segregation ATPase
MDPDSLTNTLEKMDDVIAVHHKDVYMLNESLKRLTQEKEVVLKFLENSKGQKNAKHTELTNRLKALESQIQSEDSEFLKAFDTEKKTISKEMDNQIENERKEFEDAENELKRHAELKLEMEAYEREMDLYNVQKTEYDQQLKKIKYDFMLKMAIENQKLQHEQEAEFQKELYKDKEEAETQIKKLGIEIHENNADMNEQSIQQRLEIERIKKQKDQIQKMNKSYM